MEAVYLGELTASAFGLRRTRLWCGRSRRNLRVARGPASWKPGSTRMVPDV